MYDIQLMLTTFTFPYDEYVLNSEWLYISWPSSPKSIWLAVSVPVPEGHTERNLSVSSCSGDRFLTRVSSLPFFPKHSRTQQNSPFWYFLWTHASQHEYTCALSQKSIRWPWGPNDPGLGCTTSAHLPNMRPVSEKSSILFVRVSQGNSDNREFEPHDLVRIRTHGQNWHLWERSA